MMKKIEESINKLLANWNPIGVPSYITHDEYSSYVPQVIESYERAKSITDVQATLVYIYTESLGYDLNDLADQSIRRLAQDIVRVLTEQ